MPVSASTPAHGAIRGRVIDRAGSPATVCATAFDDKEHDWSGPVAIDANGYYELSGLLPARYRVYFAECWAHPTDARVVLKREFLAQWLGDVSAFENAQYVTVDPGITVSNANAVMTRGSFITGVVQHNGAPLRGIFVEAYTAGTVVEFDQTDGDGVYSIPLLPGGTYTVLFTGGDHQQYHDRLWFPGTRDSGSAEAVVVSPESTTNLGTMALPEYAVPVGIARAAATTESIGQLSGSCCLATAGVEDTGDVTREGDSRRTGESRASVSMGRANAEARLPDAFMLHVVLPGIDVGADLTFKYADAASHTTCMDSVGGAEIGELSVNGIPVPVPNRPEPNTRMVVGPLELMLNEQTRVFGYTKGLEVTAIHVLTSGQRIGYAKTAIANCPA